MTAAGTGAGVLRIATRRSPLAMWQAEHVAERLRTAHPALGVELLPMTTQGDRELSRSLATSGGKGLFVKELELAMLEGRADIAVHSMKDVPAQLPDGLALTAILAAENPRDAFVSNRHDGLDALPRGARVGTASLRRQSQLKALRPDLVIEVLRGNVNTRLKRLDDGDFDAILLACAGLERLGFHDRIREALDPATFVPACAQGIIGIESRDDEALRARLAPLHDSPTAIRLAAERAFSARLGGACTVPVAGHARLDGDRIHLDGLVASPDGLSLVRDQCTASAADAADCGHGLAETLLERGARAILADMGIEA
ncbi:hydroxymethylbilane synthase [Algiphilus sp.]|uniref:hydroxymethylbilane synthase n=1 Tax=Algiphilus sp. TaxID=1872431 RepID=UPI0025C28366|nr:hydroxymethylbilane synthase [Algiphilus sp.]MCK5770577.1 hydroxymethylbilane synthase [Algiphilus sp.]